MLKEFVFSHPWNLRAKPDPLTAAAIDLASPGLEGRMDYTNVR